MNELEGTNTVGLPAEEIQLHVFACHERIHELKRELAALHGNYQSEKDHHDFYRSKVCDYMGAEIKWKECVALLRAQNEKLREALSHPEQVLHTLKAADLKAAALKLPTP